MNNRSMCAPNSHNHEKVFKERIIGNNIKIWQIGETKFKKKLKYRNVKYFHNSEGISAEK